MKCGFLYDNRRRLGQWVDVADSNFTKPKYQKKKSNEKIKVKRCKRDNSLVVCGWRDSLQFSGTRPSHHSRVLLWRNRRDVPKIAWSDQQKSYHSSARRRLPTSFENHHAKIKRTRRWSCVSPAVFIIPWSTILSTFRAFSLVSNGKPF